MEIKKNTDYKTNEHKHFKVTIPLPYNPESGWHMIYYIAVLPDKTTLIHNRIAEHKYSDGYAGATLDFLMQDGSIEKVQGPFYEYPDHGYVFKNVALYLLSSINEECHGCQSDHKYEVGFVHGLAEGNKQIEALSLSVKSKTEELERANELLTKVLFCDEDDKPSDEIAKFLGIGK